ncbi:unnamed protein product [Macrosiphum euphorbiae]|uniref:Uncharacterized protein n=1 Tax=Macrosiphum euphorbiae TaxID=13131 RepID=A0AAV0WWG5_9HEMI|nr:unnamed protein product [Macrosiphum euphorbiae]
MNTFKLSNILFNIVILHLIVKCVSESTEVTNCDGYEAKNLPPYGTFCDRFSEKCIDTVHFHFENNRLPYFVLHNFTLDSTWKSVGNIIYCKSGTCRAEFTIKIEKSTQIEYGNKTSSTQWSTLGYSEAIAKTIADSVNAGFSGMGIQFRVSTETDGDGKRSFEVTNKNGFTVLYSTSTARANTVGAEKKITCDGVQNEKIFVEARTNMARLRGNACEFLCNGPNDYLIMNHESFFKCNYVDLEMYPVHNKNIVIELRCNREMVK